MGEIYYAALTGDLVGSRKVRTELRVKMQATTLQVIEKLNQEMAEDLARPAVLTAGDEIQALFISPSRAVDFMQILTDHLFGSAAPGQEIVFGLGWGTLSTGLMPEASSVEQLDGTCFHLARESLTQAKKEKVWAVFRGFGATNDQALSSIFELMGSIRAGWTATQSLYASSVRDLKKRIDVARHYGVNPSVITESLQSSNYVAIRSGEEAARSLLQQFDFVGGDTSPE